jgi:hypothetical protein
VDTPCLTFTVQAPGPYGGAYLLAVALQALDSFLRETVDFM